MLWRGSVRLHSSITVGCHEAESNSLPDRNPGLQTAPVLCSLTLACAVPMSAHPEAIERIARNVSAYSHGSGGLQRLALLSAETFPLV